jgi:hypothetical protein
LLSGEITREQVRTFKPEWRLICEEKTRELCAVKMEKQMMRTLGAEQTINESNSQFSSKLDTWILNVGCDKWILCQREYGSAQVKSQLLLLLLCSISFSLLDV